MDQNLIAELALEHLILSRHSAGLSERVPGANLDRSAYVLMSRIDLEGPMSVPELSEAFALDISTVHRQMAKLLRSELVSKELHHSAHPVHRYVLTEQGNAELLAHRTLARERVADVVWEWPEADIRMFTDLLYRFNAEIEKHQGTPWPRPFSLATTPAADKSETPGSSPAVL